MKPIKTMTPYLFVTPAVLLFSLVVLVPIVLTFSFSFYDWNGYGTMTFAGVGNYIRAMQDPIYLLSYKHIAIYMVLTLVLEVAAGLLLAGLISVKLPGTGLFRVAFFTPVMLPMVIVAFLWMFVYNPDFGLINSLLAFAGLEELTRIWLGDTRTALIAVSVVSGWVFAGFYMTIFYAGMMRIPKDVLEAARMDGANERELFFRIKVPMIFGLVEVAVMLCVLGAFQGFDLFYVLTNGGPYHATEIVTTYLVKVVFRNMDVGYGSALAVIMTLAVVVVGIVFNRLKRRNQHVEY